MADENIPDWLTADFLKSCLESDTDNSEVSIVNFTVAAAVPAGNNYASNLLRVKADVKTQATENDVKSISLIVKAPIYNGMLAVLGDSVEEIYQKEPRFYNEYIPETYKLCKHDIVPKHYTSPNPLYVVLEDLNTAGFKMVDRHDLLDFDHCQLYVKSSAKLHALAMAVNKRNPGLIDLLVKESSQKAKQTQQMNLRITQLGLQCMVVYLKDKPGYNKYLNIISKAEQSGALWKMLEENKKSDKSLKTMIQFDPWCTNMMFKYNSSGYPVAIKIFDFQGMKLKSPVVELVTFMSVCPKPEVRKTRAQELYQLYCDSLNINLLNLGCPERLPYEDLIAEVTALGPLRLMLICTFLPVCLADELIDLNECFSTDAPVEKNPLYRLYNGATFNKYFPQMLDQLAQDGVFLYIEDALKQDKFSKNI